MGIRIYRLDERRLIEPPETGICESSSSRHLLQCPPAPSVAELTVSPARSKLFYGLDFLYQLDQAKTYHQRRALLCRNGDSPPRATHMLSAEFWHGSTFGNWDDWHWNWDRMEESIREGDYASVSIHWEHIEPDAHGSAPWRVWREAHLDCYRVDVFYYEPHSWLRRCGYLLWDHPEKPLSDKELRDIIVEARKLSLLYHFRRNDRDAKAKMKKSWRERAEIFRRGGRGYWSEGDASQVVWSKDTPPLP